MEMKEVVILKQECEKRIYDIISTFMEVTGCSVESVSLYLSKQISGKVDLSHVLMDVRLLNYIACNKRQG
jgi:hypothetical protein